MVVDKNVAYAGGWYPHHNDQDLEEIKAAGCTSINMTLNESDWYVFRAARERIVEKARELGLKVYLNWHGFGAFASYIQSTRYLLENPGAAQYFSNGVRSTEAMACPNNPEFAAWMEERAREIIPHFAPDGVFWDEPHFSSDSNFPNVWACRCSSCQEAFSRRFRRAMPIQLDADVRQFRQDSLLIFLTRLIRASKEVGGGENVLCLMPLDESGNHPSSGPGWYGVDDWEPFVAVPEVDVFSTDPYWIHRHGGDWDYFTENTRKAIDLSHKYDKPCQIWVQSIWIPPNKEPEVKRTILAAAEMGADMLAVWSFLGEPGGTLYDWGGDPALAWQNVVEAYQEL